MCNFCDGSANTNCYSCITGYRLLDDSSTCVSRFSAGSIANQFTCYTRRCDNYGATNSGCPVKYYFYVSQSTANGTSPYSTWVGGASVNNNDGSRATTYNYRQYNGDGICYFCDSHC